MIGRRSVHDRRIRKASGSRLNLAMPVSPVNHAENAYRGPGRGSIWSGLDDQEAAVRSKSLPFLIALRVNEKTADVNRYVS
jgi:hypothetical protein